MTTRFCPGCQAEVEDTGGFCLLGHRLALEAPVASLSALREEVDASFEASEYSDVSFEDDTDESWDQVVEPVMAGAVTAPPAPPARRVGPPPPPPPAAPASRPPAPPAPVLPSTAVPPAPARRVPPPPPPPARPEGFVSPLGRPAKPSPPPPPPVADRTFAAAIPPSPSILPPNPASPAATVDTLAGDPITAFAPAPRMDWGPEKSRLKRLGRRSRRSDRSEPSE
jgi:hypothetical protein